MKVFIGSILFLFVSNIYCQDFNTLTSKADVLYEQEDYLGATYYYTKSLELNAASAETFYKRGMSRKQFGDYRGAISDFSKAIDLNPVYADAYYNRGLARKKVKDYSGAFSDISYSLVARGMQAIVPGKNK